MEHLSLSDWLRRLRLFHDLTQEALAEQVGCAVQTIRAFENGWRRPSRSLAERLATVLEIPPTERDAFMHAARMPLQRRIPATEPAPAAPPPIDYGSYLAQLVATAPTQFSDIDQHSLLDRLDTEFDTLQAALAWALDPQRQLIAMRVELALRTASSIKRFWYERGHQVDGQRWLEQGIDLVDRTGLEIAPTVLAAALSSAGWLAKLRGDRAQAMALLQRSVGLYRTLGDPLGTSDALEILGELALFNGDAIAATWFHEEGLALRRGLARPELVVRSLHGSGHAEILRGYHERAAERFLESLQILHDGQDLRNTALALSGLGLACLRHGNHTEAAQHLHTAMDLFHTLDAPADVGRCLELIAELVAVRALVGGANNGAILEAIRLWAASEQLLEVSEISHSLPELARRDLLINPVRLRIGLARFQSYWNEGRALTQSEAIAVGQAAAHEC
jgi:transcriptional regulator with XRE-family HTH domain